MSVSLSTPIAAYIAIATARMMPRWRSALPPMPACWMKGKPAGHCRHSCLVTRHPPPV